MAITVSTGPPFDDRQEALLLRANALSSPSNIGPTEPSQAVPLVPIRAKVRVATARRSRENQAGYAAATRGEIPTIIAKIPNDELALQ
jgi:hypothetical protein